MKKGFALAAATVLILGLASTAVAAPIIVTYALAPGTGTAVYTPSLGTAGSGNGGGTMTIVYTSGSTALGGPLGTQGTMQSLAIALTTPAATPGALTIPGIGAGFGATGTRTAGGVGAFAGPTYLPAGVLSPGQPAISGTVNALGFNPLGAITILLSGTGNQVIGYNSFAWTLAGIVGQEISRTAVPEPGTTLLLLGGLAGLAGLAGGARRRRHR